MKNIFYLILILYISTSFSACNRKTGCPAMDQKPELGKGNKVKKGAHSRLFSPKSKIKNYKNPNTKMI